MNVKSWINWSNSGPPTQLFYEGKLANSPAGIARTMNMFFIDKVKKLQKKIPTVVFNPLEKLRESMVNRQCVMSVQAVKPDDVLKIISNLKNSKSSGVDDIDTYIIIHQAYCIRYSSSSYTHHKPVHHSVSLSIHLETCQSCTLAEER